MGDLRSVGEFVTVERGLGPGGRVAVVRFDRRDRLNALSMQAMRDLRDAARSFEDDTDTSAVVLTGTATAFSAGFDLNDNESYHRDSLGMGERRQLLRIGPQLCDAWERMDQVTIAAIEGHCIGGGAALVVSLDFRTCGKSSHFRIPEVALGMNMSWGSVPRILHLIGPARTKQAVILANERISSAQAREWGLVEDVVPDGSVFAATRDFADRVAAHPPIPVRMVKQSVNALSTALDDLSAHMDVDQYALSTMTEDFREGVAAFKQRRVPHFRGR
jgi:enoyl-CoA hydratase